MATLQAHVKIGVPTETLRGEHRVALVADGVAGLASAGFQVAVQSGAGSAAGFPDEAYREAGAAVESSRVSLLEAAGVVLAVQPPSLEDIRSLRAGAITVSFLQPAQQAAVVEALAAQGVTAFSMELLPRISRAQSMDALSSQASLAGYKAVVMAANRLDKFFPMLMTAAGTIPPARVLVLGAGVAGLQAIATARRLGAVVEAYDVRRAVKEEVKSLGATFLELELEAQEGEGGYAREQSEAYLARQRELLAERVGAADVVITTAAVPGRRAPLLVTAVMVRAMRPGSVIVDLAADSGGNCELTQPGQVVEVDGVWLDGTTNVPSTMAAHASRLYSRNISNLLLHLAEQGGGGSPPSEQGGGGSPPSEQGGQVRLDFEDEITRGACVTHGGEIVNERAREMMAAAVER